MERRGGRCIRLGGPYRDPLAGGQGRSRVASGIRWIVLTLIVTPPGTTKPWALPVPSLPSPTPKLSAQLGRRHQTIAGWARPLILGLHRGLPGTDRMAVGDAAPRVIELGLCCRPRGVRLIAPWRFAPPPRPAGTIRRPRLVGDHRPNLEVLRTDPSTT